MLCRERVQTYTEYLSRHREGSPHWTDAYSLTARQRACLRWRFETEAEFRDCWPLREGDIPNLGAKSIEQLGELMGLTDGPLDPEIAGLSDTELLELADKIGREVRRRRLSSRPPRFT